MLIRFSVDPSKIVDGCVENFSQRITEYNKILIFYRCSEETTCTLLFFVQNMLILM